MKKYDVVVVGGGASGMMAAGTAAGQGKSVLLLEKNAQVGAKLQITGGGRCNITHAEYDVRKLLRAYGRAEPFLYSPFSQFGVDETFSFFASQGVPCKVEAYQRAFPVSEKATDVCAALLRWIRHLGVEIKTGVRVHRINHDGQMIHSLETSQGEIFGDHIILATGGTSHPETGSTGDGFVWLRDLGHTVIDPTPTLVPLRVADAWVRACAGLTFDQMTLTFFQNDEKKFRIQGRLLCTHEGISGPVVLNSSARVRELLDAGFVTARLDMFPDHDHGALDHMMQDHILQGQNKLMKNILREVLPLKLLTVFVEQGASIMASLPQYTASLISLEHILETPGHSCTQEMRKILVSLCKGLPMTILSLLGDNKAITVDGGVPLKEINMKTMRSLKIHNLSITGDLLDITRPSGGFSLQLCWTTGYVAGMHTHL